MIVQGLTLHALHGQRQLRPGAQLPSGDSLKRSAAGWHT